MRLILRILSAIVITIAVGVAILTFLPGQKLAELAAQQIEKQTGRQVVFGGDVRFSFWPTLGIQADDVALANADWAGPEPLLTAGRLTIGVDAADLIRGDIRITELTAIVPHLNLETREDGIGNWVFDAPASGETPAQVETDSEGEGTSVAIEAITLRGASLRFAAHGQDVVETNQVDLQLAWPDPNGTANVDLTLRPAGKPLRIAGEVGSFRRFLLGEVASLGVTVTAEASKLRFDGQADLSGAFDGRITGASDDTSALLVALGQAAVDLPKGLGRAMTFAADTTYTPDGRVSLRDLSLALDHNALRGDADLNLAASPLKVTAALEGDMLDLSALGAPTTGAGGNTAEPATQGWSTTPIDASMLALVEGQISLDVKGLQTSSVIFGPSRMTLSIERARAVLSFLPVQAFGGTLQGELIANNRNGLSVAGNLQFANVEMREALGQLAGYDKLNGEALGNLEFLGVGNSMDQIMRSLDGKGRVELGKGFFTGFDLQSVMDPNGGNGGTTIFEGLTASFDMIDGTLRNDDLNAALKVLKAAGAGRVGVGSQDLDYTFTPTAFASETSAGVSVPVRIQGSWFDPEIKPDLSKLVQPKLDEVEEKAKQAVRDKLSEELGVPVETEEDLNDALKRRVEEEARKQLLKFLGSD
ncbi:AsmA family protein [Tritonibacter mobilis]|uniref:AsmA family protein n=1 Tax=Tritonibacter mobilis TaxID=379347 RepID=UPI003A5BB8EF